MGRKRKSEEQPMQEAPEYISKSAAVRAAMDAGIDSPEAAVNWVREHHGLEISRQFFSAVKSNTRRKEGAPSRSQPADEDIFEAIEQVKGLIARHGVEKLKRLIDALA